jgi:NDP-sugar pyrophosphorylase family protein
MERKPFTITMRKDLIDRVDSLVDGTKIRNRSHALEYVVASHFKPKIKKALILAGGEGVKMRPFTYELPKTMLPVKGRPILEHIIELLRSHDVRDIYVAIGHLGGKIKDHFGDGSKFGVRINYLEEKKSCGTGGAIKNALPVMGSEPFLLIWGDVLIDIDLDDFIEFHLEESSVLTVALTSTSNPTDYGVVRMHGNNVVEYNEKPKKTHSMSHLVSAGVHIVDPSIVDYLPNKSNFTIERDVIGRLIFQNKIKGYVFEGKWFDVGTPEIYHRAIKEWES